MTEFFFLFPFFVMNDNVRGCLVQKHRVFFVLFLFLSGFFFSKAFSERLLVFSFSNFFSKRLEAQSR